MAGPLLEVTGLSKRFGGFVALDGIDLTVAEGERVGLIGPNGSGKSTLVNCICGTLVNETGTVRFDGKAVDGLLTHERTRRGMARSFQLPRPFATLTVADNLRVPLLYTVNARPGRALSPAALDARCAELLQLVALSDKAAQLPRDLFESALKRDVGVKNASRLLAAHGGMLDRLDAILFSTIASYYFIAAVAGV